MRAPRQAVATRPAKLPGVERTLTTCQAGTSLSQVQASAGVPLGTLDNRGVIGAIKRAREEQSGACTAATRAPWNSGSPHNVVGSPPTWHHRKQAKTRSGYARVARRSRCWRVTSVSRRRRRQPRPKLGAKRCINVINMHHLKTDHAADILPAAHVRASVLDASPHCVPPQSAACSCKELAFRHLEVTRSQVVRVSVRFVLARCGVGVGPRRAVPQAGCCGVPSQHVWATTARRATVLGPSCCIFTMYARLRVCCSVLIVYLCAWWYVCVCNVPWMCAAWRRRMPISRCSQR